MAMRLRGFALLLITGALAWLPSRALAGPPPVLPASVDFGFASPNAAFVSGSLLGSSPREDIEHGCEFSFAGEPDISVSPSGAIDGECDNHAEEDGGGSVGTIVTDETGTYSGSINPANGDTVFSYVATETIKFGTNGKTRTYEIEISGTATTTTATGVSGIATFTMVKSCTPGTGFDVLSLCTTASRDFGNYTGTVPFGITLTGVTSNDPRVDHIEVVQVVQDITNSIPLVAYKSAVVRVFVTSQSNELIVAASLHGKRGNDDLGFAEKLPGGAATAAPVVDRENTTGSLNFKLPKEWLEPGTIELEATITPGGPPDPNMANNTKKQTVTFQVRNKIFLEYIDVCVEGPPVECGNESGGATDTPSRAISMLPLADDGIIYKRAPGPPIMLEYPPETDLTLRLARYRLERRWTVGAAFKAAPTSQLVGWMRPGHTGDVLGIADPAFKGGNGRVLLAVWDDSKPDDSFDTLAHELAHNFGAHHLNTGDSCESKDSKTDWPFQNSRTNRVGWNTRANKVMPSASFEFMGYCGTATDRWVSEFNYLKIFDRNAIPPAPSFAPRAQVEYFMVGGFVDAPGNAGSILDTLYTVSTTEFGTSDPAGTHCITFNIPGYDYCFTPTFEGDNDEDVSRAYFFEVVPVPLSLPTFTSVKLCKAPCGPSDTLATKTKSPSSPAVLITSPNFDESFEGDNATLSWSVNDLDGDPVTFNVLYSPNGGQTWDAIATGVTTTSLTFDSDLLAGSTNGVFHVLASDGFNVSEAYSGVFPVGTARPWGDLRCDGSLDLGDLLTLKREAAGLDRTPSAGCKFFGSPVSVAGHTGDIAWADLKCDGVPGAEDALELMRVIAGFAATTPAPGCPAVGAATYATW